jgi:cardiolipin synthase A/B
MFRRLSWLLASFLAPMFLLLAMQAAPGLARPYTNDERGAAAALLDFVAWDFEEATAAPSLDLTGNATATGGAGLGGESFPQGYPAAGLSWSFSNWSLQPEPDLSRYLEFRLELSDYEKIRLRFAERRSGTGPANFEIHYSLNGSDFTLIPDTVRDIPNNTSWRLRHFDFSDGPLNEMLKGQPEVYFRIYGYQASSTVGRWRVDNVTFSGVDSNAPQPVDLMLMKAGPATAAAGQPIAYQLTLQNGGVATASGILLTDTLPAGLTYSDDDSGRPLTVADPHLLVWPLDDLPPGASFSFNLTVTVGTNVLGLVTNEATVRADQPESNPANNDATAVTQISDGGLPVVLIDAVLYRGYEIGQLDEAVRLLNVGSGTADLSGWQLGKGSTQTTTLPADTLLPPGQALWLTKRAEAFRNQFGFLPTLEAENSVDSVAKLAGGWPQLPDAGGMVILVDGAQNLVDTLIYKRADLAHAGWSGPALQPYLVTGVFAEPGQILYRRRDQATGLPVPDSNSAADWAQANHDPINGRKVQYPGWRLDDFFFPLQVTQSAVLTVAIAPDNAYEALLAEIAAATSSIQIEALTFENIALATALVNAANRGVAVTVLLEGGPVGGIPDAERYVCRQLEIAGGQCWFMINESSESIYDRYRFLHAKFVLVDGRVVAISSENLSPNSLPDDDKSDGTWGRRGVILLTDAPAVVASVRVIFDADLNLAHRDILRWTANHPLYGDKYGAPPIGFVPITVTGGVTYTVRYSQAVGFQGDFGFELVQAPENALRDRDALLGLVNRAGAGDTLLVQQLAERPYWGSSGSNPADDPNPRLEAYLAAARRGARVRLLLDAYFNDGGPLSNEATCAHINAVRHAEGLDLRCALSNPTGLGIHNKMVLAQVGGRGYLHVGSINGTENAAKANRELALQVQSDGAYTLLAGMFWGDWPHAVYLPLAFKAYVGPAGHVLISELLYDPYGADDAEFIELVNPTPFAIDISGYTIGDAVEPADFEDMRVFPEGSVLQPGKTVVIATTATAFRTMFGFNPDFEILESDTTVPTLMKDPNWGHPNAFLQLANHGDEVILRNAAGEVIDVVVYGAGYYPGVEACPLVSAPQRSLERYPYWRHTGHCATDFREWAFPNPGSLPP